MASYAVILHGAVTVDADVASFESLGDEFARDAGHVYWRSLVVDGADPASFEVLGRGYARDSRRVWCERKAIDAEAATARIVPAEGDGATLLVDGARAFLDGWPVAVKGDVPFDVRSLRGLRGAFLADDRNVFARAGLMYGEERLVHVPLERERLRLLGTHHATDGERVFYEDALLEGLVAAKTEIVGEAIATDGERLFARDRLRTDVDAKTFQRLSAIYAVDRSHVFVLRSDGPARIEAPHRETFEAMGDYYGRDRARVYHYGGVVEADAQTFADLGFGFARDQSHVFYESVIVDDADPLTFRHIGHFDEVDYACDGARVFRRQAEWGDHWSGERVDVIEGARPETFEVLSPWLARDASSVFAGYAVLAGADRATFGGIGALWRDERHLYDQGGGVIHGALPASCQVRGEYLEVHFVDGGPLRALGNGYARSDLRVYFQGAVVDGADPATFAVAGGGFARDGARVYHYAMWTESRKFPAFVPVGGAVRLRPEHLRRLGEEHATDGESVSYGTTLLEGIVAPLARALGGPYVTDGTRVWCATMIVEGADAATFEVLGGSFWAHSSGSPNPVLASYYARDRARLYCGHEPIDALQTWNMEARVRLERLSVRELRVLDAQFGSDGAAVLSFLERAVIEEADATTFEALGEGYGRDARSVFYVATRMADAETSSFERLGGDGYARDRRAVYFRGREVRGAQPEAFAALGGGFATDGEDVYWGIHPVPLALDSFALLVDSSSEMRKVRGARDASGVLFLGGDWPFVVSILVDTTPHPIAGELVLLGDHYTRSGGVIGWGATELMADPATFVVLGDGYARDVRNAYFCGARLL